MIILFIKIFTVLFLFYTLPIICIYLLNYLMLLKLKFERDEVKCWGFKNCCEEKILFGDVTDITNSVFGVEYIYVPFLNIGTLLVMLSVFTFQTVVFACEWINYFFEKIKTTINNLINRMLILPKISFIKEKTDNLANKIHNFKESLNKYISFKINKIKNIRVG